MSDCLRRVVRTYLRIKRRNFDRKIYNREKVRICAQRVDPVSCFARETLEQIEIPRRIFSGLGFADDSFSQKIDRKSNFLGPALAHRPHHVIRISFGDELARHFGNVPAQEGPADTWSQTRS